MGIRWRWRWRHGWTLVVVTLGHECGHAVQVREWWALLIHTQTLAQVTTGELAWNREMMSSHGRPQPIKVLTPASGVKLVADETLLAQLGISCLSPSSCPHSHPGFAFEYVCSMSGKQGPRAGVAPAGG